MPSFGDLQSASRMRDLIEHIASRVVEKKRPDTRIGRVQRVDAGRQLAWVHYVGDDEDSLVKVRVAKNMLPTKTVDTDGDAADIVRVAGKPGGYYVIDFLRGEPYQDVSVISQVLTGAVFMWPTGTAPAGYLECDGTVYNIADYPVLGAQLGSTFGGNGTTTFAVPNYTDKFPIGTGTKAIGTTGGSSTQTLTIANMPAHSHNMDHNHQIKSSATAGGSTLAFTRSANTSVVESFGAVTSFTGNTGPNGSGTAFDVMNPWLAINFIIKT